MASATTGGTSPCISFSHGAPMLSIVKVHRWS
jgi:hypothetical protein